MISYNDLWNIQEPILAFAAIAQAYMHFSNRIQSWRNATANWWVNLQLVKWSDRHDINIQFVELFHKIYGEKTISIYRVVSSSLSSIIFLIFFYFLILNIFPVDEQTTKYLVGHNPYYNWINYNEMYISFSAPLALLATIFDSIGINLIPDFISLAQTAWILKLACRKGSNLPALFLLDLTLTLLIAIAANWVGTLYTDLVVNQYYYFSFERFVLAFSLQPLNNIFVWNPYSSWAMVLTTFSTSLLWIVFLLTVIIGAIVKRSSLIFVKLLESKWVSDFPIVLIVGIPCMVSWTILYFLNLVIK